jgi:hypothetical protein
MLARGLDFSIPGGQGHVGVLWKGGVLERDHAAEMLEQHQLTPWKLAKTRPFLAERASFDLFAGDQVISPLWNKGHDKS